MENAVFEGNQIDRPCKCGCGQPTLKGREYVHGHNRRGQGKKTSSKHLRLTSKQKSTVAHRLVFPERREGETIGDCKFRKFEYFCSHYVTHVAGKYAGRPVILMAWQQDILKRLFATMDETGKRIYRRLFIHVPRKNGKTFMVVLLVLFFLCEESFDDLAAEICSCANTREQSIKTIFRTARLMVAGSKELNQLIKTNIVPPALQNRLTNAIFEPLASDSKPQLGKNVSLAIFDETHGQPNSELWDAMSTSQSMREEPLFVSISTAGNSRSSFYYTIYERMKEIEADPAQDPTTLTAIYEAPEGVDWRDPKTYIMANPSVGSDQEPGFRSTGELELALREAVKGEGENGYRQFYLNQWSKYGSRTIVSLPKWDLCAVENLDPGPESVGWIGLDLSLTTALTGVAVLFAPEEPNKKFKIVTYAWLAGEDISECSRRDHLPYEKWVNSEILFFDGKPTIDPASILDLLLKVKYQFPNVETIGFDPYAKVMLKGFDDYFNMVPIQQQYAILSPAVKALQVMILKGSIEHEGDPLMRSMIENAKLVEDFSGSLRLDKSRSISRIDCLSALVCAVAVMIEKKEEDE